MAIKSVPAKKTITAGLAAAGAVFSLPFRGVAWVGNKTTSKLFSTIDDTAFGHYVSSRAYRIGGPSMIIGDFGFVGFAFEQGNPLQISGAFATAPAHLLMALIGDKQPLILELIDKGSSAPIIGKSISVLKPSAEFIVSKKHLIIPTAWTMLAYNGFSLAAATITRPKNEALTHFAEKFARWTHNPQIIDAIHRFVHTPIVSQSTDILMKAPEGMQGIAILTGCVALAVNQYLKLSNANATGQSAEKQETVDACAERIGDFAIGILSSCNILTFATGLVDLSPSLLLCSVPAFLLGNYCQDKMRRTQTKVPVLGS